MQTTSKNREGTPLYTESNSIMIMCYTQLPNSSRS